MKKQQHYFQKGFSLLEILVVLAIFVLVVLVAGALFISIVDRQRNMLAEQEIISQASLATEYMSRSLRNVAEDTTGGCTGTVHGLYLLTHHDDWLQFYQGVKFLNQDNVCQEFYIDQFGFLKESKNGSVPQNIFSDKYKINYLRFALNGVKTLGLVKETDSVKPRITMVLSIQKLADKSSTQVSQLFTVNYAKAQFAGIPTCGDGVCDPGESVYCSNRCPLVDDCNTCIAPPQIPTGLSCSGGVCTQNPNGFDTCTLGSPCGSSPNPPTGLACINNQCLQSPSGTDTCTLGSACNLAPPTPTTGFSCINNTCSPDPLGTDTCSVGSSCNTAESSPSTPPNPNEIIIQTTISRTNFK